VGAPRSSGVNESLPGATTGGYSTREDRKGSTALVNSGLSSTLCAGGKTQMKPLRLLVVALLLVGSAVAQENRCSDIAGNWKWFVGPELMIKADHTFSNGENSGTWKLADASEQKYTLTWDVGGFVDEVTLSKDGLKLTGTNNQKNNVAGERVGKCTNNRA
jgi:hypothetical protein